MWQEELSVVQVSQEKVSWHSGVRDYNKVTLHNKHNKRDLVGGEESKRVAAFAWVRSSRRQGLYTVGGEDFPGRRFQARGLVVFQVLSLGLLFYRAELCHMYLEERSGHSRFQSVLWAELGHWRSSGARSGH